MFKRSIGVGALIALVISVAHHLSASMTNDEREGSGQTVPSLSLRPPSVLSLANSARLAASGTNRCTAYLPDQPPSTLPRDETLGAATRVLNRFFDQKASFAHPFQLEKSVQVVVALVPDPVRTNLGLFFDRELVSIQQAAQDENYDYDSAWLPWTRGGQESFSKLDDRQYAAILANQRENCPGVLLFRKHLDESSITGTWKPDNANAYSMGLVVLLVGEQPTGGVNRSQWSNAMDWITTQVAADKMGTHQHLAVLGPTFSGSFPSLLRSVQSVSSHFSQMLILSGSTTNFEEIRNFTKNLARVPLAKSEDGKSNMVMFGSFNENDELHISRFLEYLGESVGSIDQVAVLSEDETAYASAQVSTGQKSCGNTPLALKYPRDISVLRDAYQKQSVFDSIAGKEHLVHPVLRSQSGNASNESLDTLPSYSGDIAAIDQEARLFALVDDLRAHHARYIILRATNPLDFLFLSRFFNRAYPDARIVTVGSDLLFRREIDTTEFRGSLALTTYPLISREQHWFSVKNGEAPAHLHDVFAGNLAEGGYMAARYAFNVNRSCKVEPVLGSDLQSLSCIRLPQLPSYGDPFWLENQTAKGDVSQPPTWLLSLGRDGYWPIAALKKVKTDASCQAAGSLRRVQSTLVQLSESGISSERPAAHQGAEARIDGLTLHWKVCMVLAVLLVMYQVVGVWDRRPGEGTFSTSDDLFFIYHNNPYLPTQALLRGFSFAVGVMPFNELIITRLLRFQGIGLRHLPVFDRVTMYLSIPVVLLATTLALWRRVEERDDEPKDPLKLQKQKERRRAAICFLGCSALLVSFFFFLGHQLVKEESFPFIYRMEHLTNGLSPLMPILLLTLGFYLWTWQTLAGNLIVGPGRPRLPLCEVDKIEEGEHELKRKIARGPIVSSPLLSRAERWYKTLIGFKGPYHRATESWMYLSADQVRLSDKLGRQILLLANPFEIVRFVYFPVIPPIVLGIVASRREIGPTTLEGVLFTNTMEVLLLLAVVITMLEALRLYSTWVQLRKLLLALGRSRLRAAIKKLQPIAAGSLWTVSTNVHRVQYRLFFQQHEAARRLVNLYECRGFDRCIETVVQEGQKIIEKSRVSNRGVAHWWWLRLDIEGRTIRHLLSYATAYLINNVLKPTWHEDHTSLFARESDESNCPVVASNPALDDGRKDQLKIDAAEEFVAVQYIAFVQNILARMRTITLAMALVFIFVCFSVAFYPFQPRGPMASLLVADLLVIGGVVAYVYAGMDRDEVLSSIANTSPGRLGSEFWIKFAGFIIGPVFGVLTTQFPAIAETLFGWIQPSMNSFK